jgi:large subunit ribosomal protein L31
VTKAGLAQKSFTSLWLTAVAFEEPTVKADLHPMYRKVMAVCACGNQFETRSTAQSIHVEVCAQCHPYFTGKQRLVDTAGRVDRFRRKYKTETAAAKA